MKEDYYALLGVSRESDEVAIKRAYLARAKQLHPDLNDGVTAAEEMKALNLAYELLSDPARRAEYDAKTAPRVNTTPPRSRPTPRPQESKVDFDFDLAARDFASANRDRLQTLNHEYVRMTEEGWNVERVHDHLVCTRTVKRRSIVGEYLTVVFGVLFALGVIAALSPGASEQIQAAKTLLVPILVLLGCGLAYSIHSERSRPPRRQQRVTVSVGADGLPMVHVQPA